MKGFGWIWIWLSIGGCSERKEVKPTVLNVDRFEEAKTEPPLDEREVSDEMENPTIRQEESRMKSGKIVVEQFIVDPVAGGSSVRGDYVADLRAELDALQRRIQDENLSFVDLMRIREEVLQLTALVDAWESM